jgi:hypothetical protein
MKELVINVVCAWQRFLRDLERRLLIDVVEEEVGSMDGLIVDERVETTYMLNDRVMVTHEEFHDEGGKREWLRLWDLHQLECSCTIDLKDFSLVRRTGPVTPKTA